MTQQRHYYAIHLDYGVMTDDRDGLLIGRVHRFETQRDRTLWISQGNPNRTGLGHRMPILAKSDEVRRSVAMSYDQRGW